MATGYFKNGDPYIDVDVSNPLGWKRTLSCLIDTGFTGFLSVPILQAFPIGLLLHSTVSVTLADGSTSSNLVCLGTAHLPGESQAGLIFIEAASSQVLLGLEFLKKFSKKLVIDPITQTVELVSVTPPPGAAAMPVVPLLPPTP